MDKLTIKNGEICVLFECGYAFPWIKAHKMGVFNVAKIEHNKSCDCGKRVRIRNR